MRTIRIQETNKEPRTIYFLGWTNRDERTAFLAQEENRRPLRVSLDLACPPNGHFLSNPVPDRELVEIVPYRLLPPPCRKTEEEAKAIDDPLAYFEPWERMYGACMYLRDADEKPLREEWADFKRRARAAYEEQREAVRKLTPDDYRRERYGAKSCRKVTRAEVEKWRKDKLATVETIFNMVKDNAGAIRDRYLHDLWATERKIDLSELEQERERFKRMIERTTCNAMGRHYNMTHRETCLKPDLVMYWPNWMCLFASVRYRARFDDGSLVYLSDFTVSEQLTPAELADVKQYGVEDASAADVSGGTRFDPKSGEVIVGRERTPLVGDALKIVRATADWMRDHPEERRIDLGLLVDDLKKHGEIEKTWPNKGRRVDQLFNAGGTYSLFKKLYNVARGKQKKVSGGRHTQLYDLLFSLV